MMGTSLIPAQFCHEKVHFVVEVVVDIPCAKGIIDVDMQKAHQS